MLASSFLFAGMGIFVKLGSTRLSATDLLFFRSAIGLAITFVLLRSTGISLKTSHWRAHLVRSMAGFVAMVFLFKAITLLPVATAMTLNYTSPIFLTLIVLLVHQSRPGFFGHLAIAIGFLGVMILLRPSFEDENWVGEVIGLGSGFLAGVAIHHARQLGKLGEPSARIVFYFMLVCSLCSGAWMIASGSPEMSWTTVIWILGVGLFGTGGQLAMTRAYSISHSATVSGLAYSTVMFTSVFGSIFLDESLDIAAWLGIGLIVLGGIFATASNQSRTSA